MSKNKKKTSLLNSIKNMFSSLFRNKKRELDLDESIMSPSEQIRRNFFENRLGVTGLIGFITIFVIVFSFTTFGKPYDPYSHEPLLENVGPGRKFLKVPSNLKNPVKIQTGVSFSVALDEEGKVHFWGKEPNYGIRIADIEELTKEKKIVDIAAGARHVIALTSTGEIIGAGLNNFDQTSLTNEMQMRLMGEKIKNVYAGVNFSAVLTQSGKVYTWGSTVANELDIIPRVYQGRVVDLTVTPFNMLMILDDGTVGVAGIRSSSIASSIPEELTTGEVKVTSVTATETAAMALDSEGKLHIWGTMMSVDPKVTPEFTGDIVQVSSTRYSFHALDDAGKLYSWGAGKYGLSQTPSSLENKKISNIFSNFYGAYAVDESGDVTSWGLKGFLLGSDVLGRDVGERLLQGGRVSLTVGAVAIIISLVIGVTVGLIAGFYGGWIDNLLMRIAEVISAFPFMPLAITLSALMPSTVSQNQRLALIMVIMGIISWPSIARLVRGQILAEREKDFVLAARALGLKEKTIIVKHILPSVFNLIIVNMTLGYASSLLTEAGLSYLGFGVQAPSPSWGNMLNGVVNSTIIERYWWQWLLPAVSVLLAALSVNLIGDALRDAMDPRSNQK